MSDQRWDESSAEVLVFTYKEGLLSAVAHDLKLKVGRFSIAQTADGVKAEFDAGSIRVVCARKDGADAPSSLPGSAPAEIERNLRDDVLRTAKFPQIQFESSAISGQQVTGRLTLCGVSREVRCQRRDEGSWLVAEARVDQREFGVKPYSAMLGTLKIKPEVVVQVRLPKG